MWRKPSGCRIKTVHDIDLYIYYIDIELTMAKELQDQKLRNE